MCWIDIYETNENIKQTICTIVLKKIQKIYIW